MTKRKKSKSKKADSKELDIEIKKLEEKLAGLKLRKKNLEPKPKTVSRKDFRKMKERYELSKKADRLRGL